MAIRREQTSEATGRRRQRKLSQRISGTRNRPLPRDQARKQSARLFQPKHQARSRRKRKKPLLLPGSRALEQLKENLRRERKPHPAGPPRRVDDTRRGDYKISRTQPSRFN